MGKFFLTLSMLVVSTTLHAQCADDFGYTSHPDTAGIGLPVGTPMGRLQVSELGGASYQVAIDVPKGINGMTPSICLNYNSQSGNGMAGLGTTLSGFSIITRGKQDLFHDGVSRGIKNDGLDAFYLDGKRLCFISGVKGQEGARYTVEGIPMDTVVCHQNNSSIWFELRSHDGKIVKYGETDDSQLYVTVNLQKRIFGWYANHVEDANGNYITYSFTREDQNLYPNRISYGGNTATTENISHSVEFLYETRTDVQSFKLSGQEVALKKRLFAILSKTNNRLFREYVFSFSNDTSSGVSILNSIAEQNELGESLSPITFEWEEAPEVSRIISTPSVTLATQGNGVGFNGSPSYMPADLTGDGLSDLIEVRAVYARRHSDPPTAPLQNLTYAYIYPAKVDTLGVLSFSQPFICELPQVTDWKYGQVHCYGPMFFDYDGDGKNDAVFPYYSYFPDISASSYYLYLFPGSNTGEANGGDYVSGYARSYEPQTLTANSPIAAWADFDGDGKGEVAVMERVKTNGKYKCRFFYHNPPSYCDIHEFSLSLPSNPKYLFSSDYNGDGLPDLLAIHQSGYKIFFNQGGLLENTLSDASSIAGNDLSATGWIYTGDFNGDGQADYLLHNGENSGDVNWHIAYGRGDGTFQKSTVALPSDIYNQGTAKDDDSIQCLVADFNGDGKYDLFINKGVYTGNNFNRTASYWLKSTGTSFAKVKSSTTTNADDCHPGNYTLGNFTGRGNTEIISYGSGNCYNGLTYTTNQIRLYTASNNSHANGKIKKITDGMGNTIEIIYDNLSTGKCYTENAMYGNATPQYPAPSVTLPLNVVRSVKTSNGVCGNVTQDYSYKGLRVQLTGKGLLGFTETEATNRTTGVTINNIITGRYESGTLLPANAKVVTHIGSYTSTSYLSYSIPGHAGGNYFHYLKTNNTYVQDEDGYPSSSTTTFTYDENTCLLAGEQSNTDGIIKATSFSNYVYKGGCHLPTTITQIQRHPDAVPGYIDDTTYAYDDRGRVVSILEHDGTTLSVETQSSYDVYGNVTKKIVNAAEAQAIETNYEYDDSHRFVTRTTTSPASSTFEYTYDTWGNLLSETEKRKPDNPLTTTYEYDGWGNLKAMVSPIGLRTQFDRGPTANGYFTLQRGTSQPWVKTTYDMTGRELSTETRGALDMVISTTTAYDDQGRVSRKESNVGDVEQYEVYDYDLRGRVTRRADSSGHCSTFTYEDKTVTENRDGHTYTKTYDAGGFLKESTDPVSSVTFLYNSQFLPRAATSGDYSIQMTYDHLGNVISQTDPDAGSLTYTYNALGQPLKKTDARGRETSYAYDNLNRIKKDFATNCFTNYTYGVSSNSAQLVSQKSTATGLILYSRDSYGRITKERRVVAAKPLTFNYTYDDFGNLATVQYPDSVFVGYTYDCYGNRTSMSVNGQTAWTLTENTGKKIRLNLSSGHLTYTYDNQNRLLNRVHTVPRYGSNIVSMAEENTTLQEQDIVDMGDTANSEDDINTVPILVSKVYDFDFSYDNITGNLLSRKINNLETFSYDELNRLGTYQETIPTLHHSLPLVVTKGVTYADNGNILSKDDVGDYSYNDESPHAISSLFGDYGYDEEDGIVRQFYWLDNGVLYVKEQGQPGSLYYVATDHQGSIIAVYKSTGKLIKEVFSATYDPWGKQTVTKNDIGLRRGYTGHEHLPEFGLINMNARLYDPVLGRFLSPDPYVQLPDFSQSYNRYSYCLNNPLKYVDPSGEFWWIVGAAVIGGVINVAMNWNDIDNFWEGLATFGVGATSGALAATGHPYMSAIVLGAGNNVVHQGFENGFGNIDWWNVGTSATMSLLTMGMAQQFSGYITPVVDKIIPEISSPILDQVLRQGMVYSSTGFSVSTLFSLGTGSSLKESLQSGLHGFKEGLQMGVMSGAARGLSLRYCQRDYTDVEVTPERVATEVMASSKTPLGKGSNSVYVGYDDNGAARYVGITDREPQLRFKEHLRSKTEKSLLQFKTIDGTGKLSRIQARIIEQRLINLYGIQNLYNKINSIDSKYWNKYGLINK